MNVHVEFLGIPKIYINNRWVKVNKNKLNAIILYILYNEECTRDELSTMFWPESNEQRAKSNLRNALYQIRKKLGDDLIDAEGHSFINLGKKVELSKDIDIFLNPDNGEKILNLRDLVFMDKIYLKDNNEFNDWLDGVRSAYNNLILNILNSELQNSVKQKDSITAERYADKIIGVDPYNEKAYREKIKIYITNHDFNEGIKAYKTIESVVNEELGVPLESKTIELYEFMMNNKNKVVEETPQEYFDRMDLSLIISREYEKFLNNEDFNNIIVRGEIGVGKSRLIENFLKNKDRPKYTLELNKTIREIDFLALKKLMILLDIDTNKGINDAIDEFLLNMKDEEKIILYIKNLEYIDMESLDYITELLFDSMQQKIFVISEFSESISNNMEINRRIKILKNTMDIELPLLSKAEVIDYIKFRYEDLKLGEIDYNNIYNNTFGNIMFIDEYIEGKTESIGVIAQLLGSMEKEELQVLRKASVFEEYFSFEDLEYLLDMEEDKLLKIVGKLFYKKLLHGNRDEMKIKYKHLQDTLYEDMPQIYRIQIHKIIIEHYKDRELDYNLCKFLSYHYKQAEMHYEKYLYELKSLQIRLDYYDQLYPTLSNYQDRPKDFYTSREAYYREFNEMYENIKELRYMTDGRDYYRLVMMLEFLIGRTMIGGGKKEEGIVHIENCIEMCKKLGDIEYLLKSYIEYIHYGIHKEDNEIMKEYIKLSKEILGENEFYIEESEVMRLEGLYELKEGNLAKAETLLKASINAYNVPELANRNMFPIVAAYNYLGNMYRDKGDFKSAEKYYKEAIDICLDYEIKKSLDIVYAEYGYMLYLKKDYYQAEQILHKAVKLYDALGTHWKRTVVEAILGEIAYMDKDYKGAINHLRRGEIYSKKDQKPEELKILNELKKKISKIK